MEKPFKTYLFEYEFDGAMWGLRFPRRLKRKRFGEFAHCRVRLSSSVRRCLLFPRLRDWGLFLV